MSRTLLIVGACVRAAAQSARRAGWQVISADMFADIDGQAVAQAARIRRYPRDLPAFARACQASAVMYTGALENYPHLVDEIASACPLLGNNGSVLRQVRDPLAVSAALRAASLRCPATATDTAQLTVGRWLRKPLLSAGGAHIAEVTTRGAVVPAATRRRDACATSSFPGGRKWYYQELLSGRPQSGAFLAAGGVCRLLGVTQQLVGWAFTGARGFTYCGSLGPITLPCTMETQWQRIGDCLAQRFSLRGLFGVDAVVQDDTVWPVEVNPRYTASMELLERNLTLSIAQLHYDTCLEGRPPAPRVPATESQASLWGKAILFAPRDATVSEQLVAYACRLNAEQLWPQAADIPAPLTHVAAGRPVVTVFAEASDATQIMRTLRCRIAEMRELLIF